MANSKGRPLGKTDIRVLKENIKNSGFCDKEDIKILESFTTRFNEEFEKKEIKLEDFSSRIGIAKSTLSNYKNGQRIPPINVLVKIAKEFNCSTDYLLGLTELKSIDEDFKKVHEITGLSDEAILYLKNRINANKIFVDRENEDVIQTYKSGFTFINEDGKTMTDNEIEELQKKKINNIYDPVLNILNYLLENENKYSLLDKIDLYLMMPISIKNLYNLFEKRRGKDFLTYGKYRSEWSKEYKKKVMEQDVTKVQIDNILFEIKNDIQTQYNIKIPEQKY